MSEEKDDNFIDKMKDSATDYFKEKFNSPFYTTFIVSWLLWNWKVWYATFFIDAELLEKNKGILKIDYILCFYHFDCWFWGWDFLASISHLFLLPLFSSWFIVFVVSHYIDFWFYCRSRKNELQKLRENKRIEDEKEVILSETLIKKESNTAKEKEIKEIEKKSKTQEEIWDEEYEEFKKSNYFNKFDEVKICIFDNDGYGGNVPVNTKAYFKSNKIINIYPDKNNNDRLEFTEKGDYFTKKFLSEII